MSTRILRLAVFTLLLAFALTAQNEDKYNVNERILRIRELGKKKPAVLPALAQYLSDPNRDIRLEAVKAIVKIDTPASLDPLVVATRDKDEDVEIRATDGIVNTYVPGYVAKGGLTGSMTRGTRQVKSFFSSRNDQVIDEDVQIRPDAAEALSQVVASGASIDARANAALAAGILRDRAAVPALLQSLHAKDDDLIFESLIALQKIRDPAAGEGIGFLAHDLDDRIQATALETIGILRAQVAATDVRSALQTARNARIRRAALKSLAMLGAAQDRPTFLQYSHDRDPELRASALEGLGRIREPEDFPLLQQSFDEGEIDWRIHLAAAFGMVNEGKVDTSEFSPLAYLMELLGTKGRSYAASAYLTELAARENVIDALTKMIPEMDKDQKIALCRVLGNAHAAGSTAALNTLAKDIDPDVAFAASKALQITQSRRSS
ncbi:MAG: HEAT repeat domain-containing protein [Acidobacteriota bacterium]|nr:HEAT repeat domain-containing protein [Acidobacteriota bacterium]